MNQMGQDQINQMSETNQTMEIYHENQSNQDHHQDNKIEEVLKSLVCAMKESREYIRYQTIRAKVHEQPELEQKIHAFRKKNYETQNYADEWDLYDRVDGLEQEGAELRKNPFVNEYLDAELAFCRLFQKVNWEIVRNIDFDLGFVIDR